MNDGLDAIRDRAAKAAPELKDIFRNEYEIRPVRASARDVPALLEIIDGSVEGAVKAFARWLRSDDAVMVLVNHYRKDIRSCGCGWDELGQMHAKHVLEKLIEVFDGLPIVSPATDLVSD